MSTERSGATVHPNDRRTRGGPRTPWAAARCGRVGALVLVGALLFGPPAVARSEDASGADPAAHWRLERLDGRWQQADPGLDQRARLAAIESAVEPLTWVVEKMAGGVLRSTTAPPTVLHFVWDGEQLHERVQRARETDVRLIDPGGPPVRHVDARGEDFEGTWRWTREGLRFEWRQHQAFGANLYRLDPASGALTIDHAIQVTAIDGVRPILYRSCFVRADVPAVSAAAETEKR